MHVFVNAQALKVLVAGVNGLSLKSGGVKLDGQAGLILGHNLHAAGQAMGGRLGCILPAFNFISV